MRIRRMLGVVLSVVCSFAVARPAEASPRLVAGGTEKHGDIAVVGAQGAEWALPGGPVVRARPGTQIKVVHKPQNLQIKPGKTRPVYTVHVRSGRVDVEVPSDARSAVILAAPRKVMAIVRAGSAGVSASDSRVALANYEGETVAGLGADFRLLPSGAIKVVDARGVSDASVLAPPSTLEGQRLFVTAGEPVKLDRLSWNQLGGAVSYRLELSRGDSRQPVLAIETREPRLSSAPTLEPGRYKVAIKAVDALGLDSYRALESSLHVVGAELPEGAYYDSAGRIRMIPGSRVKLSFVDGLEMTYSKVSYIPALDAVGISRNEPATIFVRPENGHEHLPLRFAPRTVRARVALTPQLVTWPNDPLEVAISLEDPSGQPVPESLQMRPKVSVGLDPIKVEFRRVGKSLRATIPPQAGPGPWVVRVEVKDQYGFELGRDFIEIAPSHGRKKDRAPSRRAGRGR